MENKSDDEIFKLKFKEYLAFLTKLYVFNFSPFFFEFLSYNSKLF